MFEVPLGKFICQAPPFIKTLSLKHLSENTDTCVTLLRVLPKSIEDQDLISEESEICYHLTQHYIDSDKYYLVPESSCIQSSLITTQLIDVQEQEILANENFLNITLTYSTKKNFSTDSNDKWLLAITRSNIKNFQEDVLVISILASRISPKLTPLKTIDIVRINEYSNSYHKLKFHQKSFDLSKVFLTTNRKLKNFLLKNNFINLKKLQKFRLPENNISTSERVPHLFGTFQSKPDVSTLVKTHQMLKVADMNAQKEHRFKDYKVKNTSPCKFTFYVKLMGPFFFDFSGQSQISEFDIKENEIISIRVFMKGMRKKHIEWPLSRETLLKGVMVISFSP
jgi:hypothetical protein